LIGAKTFAMLVLLIAGTLSALALGVLSPERLLARGPGSLFMTGCFAAVVGTLMFRFWNLGEKSRHGFRFSLGNELWDDEERFHLGDRSRIAITENRGDAFDLGPRAQHAACVAIALFLSLLSMDRRTVELLERFRRNISAATSSYCPEVKTIESADDPNAPGCALVRRAYALGYATTLGDCEAKKIAARSSSGSICTLRQRDEPIAHYAWRLLTRFSDNLSSHTSAPYVEKLGQDFNDRMGRLDALESAEIQRLTTAPHASHHIFTNLPDPGGGAFREETCADRYRWLVHRPSPTAGDNKASRIFEHIVGQLMFEARYEPAAGYCREYHVHWGAPNDVCGRLAEAPEAVLTEWGALSSVRASLERYRLGKKLEQIALRQIPLEPPAFLSFDCYIEGDGPERKSTPFSLDGHELSAEEVHVPAAPEGIALYTDRYDAIAKLLVRGFHYGALLSEAGVEIGDPQGLEKSLGGSDFLLTRLYGLESFDIYLEPGWIAERPDLLDVYPYQLHLKNYVSTFRRQYRLEKGRL
jgi:hypothetical protein